MVAEADDRRAVIVIVAARSAIPAPVAAAIVVFSTWATFAALRLGLRVGRGRIVAVARWTSRARRALVPMVVPPATLAALPARSIGVLPFGGRMLLARRSRGIERLHRRFELAGRAAVAAARARAIATVATPA